MARTSQNPNPRQRKATAQEKGKRPASPEPSDSDSSSAPPRAPPEIPAHYRNRGIRLSEPPVPPASAPQSVPVEAPATTDLEEASESPSPASSPVASAEAAITVPSSDPSDFKNVVDRGSFLSTFCRRNLTTCRTVDFNFFMGEGFLFTVWLQISGLQNFLTACTEVPDQLIRLFYFYLDYDPKKARYSSFIRDRVFSFNVKKFSDLMEIPFFEDEENLDRFNRTQKILELTGNEELSRSGGPILSKDLKTLDLRMLFNVICCCLFPRVGGMTKLFSGDLDMLLAIQLGLKVNFGKYMLKYMLDQKKRKNGYLPFGMAIIRLLRALQILPEMNAPIKLSSYAQLGESTLKRMRLEKRDGGWFDRITPAHTSAAVEPLPALPASTSYSPDPPPQPQPTSCPTSSSVDFSPLFSYFDTKFLDLHTLVSTQFHLLNSRIDSVSSDLSQFKTDVFFKLHETQNMLDQMEASSAQSRTRTSTFLQHLFDFVSTQTSSLRDVVSQATSAVQDIRDNTDRVCLQQNIPSLDALIAARFADFQAEFEAAQPPPPFYQRKKAKKSQPPP